MRLWGLLFRFDDGFLGLCFFYDDYDGLLKGALWVIISGASARYWV